MSQLDTSQAPPAPVLAYGVRGALYVNLTNACTLACVFCPKVRLRDYSMGEHNLRLTVEPSLDQVWKALSAAEYARYAEVVFTGFGEPTHRLQVVLSLVRRLKQAGVRRVRLDTDGLASLRAGRNVCPDLATAGLDAVSVSLNAPDAKSYAEYCPSRFGESAYPAVQEFIRGAVRVLPEVTASVVGYPGIDEQRCRRIAESLGAHFRFRPYDPRSA